MQSTGHTSMHESSLMQLPVITYVMALETIGAPQSVRRPGAALRQGAGARRHGARRRAARSPRTARTAGARTPLVRARDLEVLAHVHVVLAARGDHVDHVGAVRQLVDPLDAALILAQRRGLGLIGRGASGGRAEARRRLAVPGRAAALRPLARRAQPRRARRA